MDSTLVITEILKTEGRFQVTKLALVEPHWLLMPGMLKVDAAGVFHRNILCWKVLRRIIESALKYMVHMEIKPTTLTL